VDGHVQAFAFFGRVPQSVLYDNDRCLVAGILPDGTRNRARLFSGFLSHYVIHDRYGRPGKGNDKGSVEGLVGWARRNFMVPLPRFASWEDFNVWLEEQCGKRHVDIRRGHTETIGQRLQRDLEAMAELPPAAFDACAQATGRVSSQALVRYKTNDYSVPVAYGHRDVCDLNRVERLGNIDPDENFCKLTHGSSSCDEDRLGPPEQPSDAQRATSCRMRTYGLTKYRLSNDRRDRYIRRRRPGEQISGRPATTFACPWPY
jgi:hypothetical protein